ncbi:MbtH family protein [Burkholderia sp. MBR-1]|uniref:MbtH family protein n=1 Tax=Burkholderia sp. MBR-1 TaxID=2732364 RepID=UPI0015EEA8C2|nr:MbtH family NRPS accessory protein [Burkholderia sp. MBR-1]QMI44690.1 MbtH family protein [Burkholderia sp. MBR-1]
MEQQDRKYIVVQNDEEQYSIWFAEREIPLGWRKIDMEGTKDQCLSYIESVWKNILPRSVREQAAE